MSGVLFSYSCITVNDTRPSHIYGKLIKIYSGIHHKCERKEYHFTIYREYLNIFPVEISFYFHPLVRLFLFIVAYNWYVDVRDVHLPKYLKFFVLYVILCSIF